MGKSWMQLRLIELQPTTWADLSVSKRLFKKLTGLKRPDSYIAYNWGLGIASIMNGYD